MIVLDPWLLQDFWPFLIQEAIGPLTWSEAVPRSHAAADGHRTWAAQFCRRWPSCRAVKTRCTACPARSPEPASARGVCCGGQLWPPECRQHSGPRRCGSRRCWRGCSSWCCCWSHWTTAAQDRSPERCQCQWHGAQRGCHPPGRAACDPSGSSWSSPWKSGAVLGWWEVPHGPKRQSSDWGQSGQEGWLQNGLWGCATSGRSPNMFERVNKRSLCRVFTSMRGWAT